MSFYNLEFVKNYTELSVDYGEEVFSQEDRVGANTILSQANKLGYKTLNQDWIDLLIEPFTTWCCNEGIWTPNYNDPDDVADVSVEDLYRFMREEIIINSEEDGEDINWNRLVDYERSQELDGDIEEIKTARRYKSVSDNKVWQLYCFIELYCLEIDLVETKWTQTVDDGSEIVEHTVDVLRFHCKNESGLSYAETYYPQA